MIHHTDCGMETFTGKIISDLLDNSLKQPQLMKMAGTIAVKGNGSAEGKHIAWLTIKDQAQSVTEDVQRIKSHH